MEVVRLVEEKVLSVTAKVLEMIEGEINYQSFETGLKKELDGLGCDKQLTNIYWSDNIIMKN